MFVNKHSDFLVLGFLTGVDVIYTLGLLSVTTSGVDIIPLWEETTIVVFQAHTN